MKKFLSLVLALIMTMSLVTVAGAEDFTDADDVNYTEAVEVLTATGIVSGYTDGSVRPNVQLNRGQAAKIICNMILGPTEAAQLPTGVAPFSDVAAGSTFAGYIAYCAKEGIINGYNDGTFRPGAPLTGYAFMKMLLGVLGYDAKIEGYTGNNWAVSVAKQALALGLDDGLVEDFLGTKTVTRQEAMLYSFNALLCPWVEYNDKGTGITIGGVEIVTGASEVKKNEEGSAYGTGLNELYLEKLFDGDLAYDNTIYDDLGRPATAWDFDSEDIGTYSSVADYVVTTNEKQYVVNKELKKGKTDNKNFYYQINANKAVQGYADNTTFVLDYYGVNDTKKLADIDVLANYAGNGVVIEFFYDEDDADNSYAVVIDEYLGKVVDEDVNPDDERVITIEDMAGNPWEFTTDLFEVEDMVLFTVGGAAAKDDVVSVTLVEKKTGLFTKEYDGTYTIGGADYGWHKTTGANTIATGTEVDFYLDSYGYIIHMEEASVNAALQNLVLITDTANSGWDKLGKAYYADGTSGSVVLDDKNTQINTVYNFSMSAGKMKVRDAKDYTSYYLNDANKYYFTKGATKLTIGDWDTASGITVNNTTTFVLIDADGNAKAYTGAKNTPSFEAAEYVVAYKHKDKVAATLVYVVLNATSNVTSTLSDFAWVIMKDYAITNTVNADGDPVSYYEVTDLAGKTYKFDIGATKGIEDYAHYYITTGVKVYKTMTEVDGIITGGVVAGANATDKVSYYAVDAAFTVKVEGGAFYAPNGDADAGLNGGVMFADDCVVYRVDKDGEVSTVKNFTNMTNKYVRGVTYQKNDNGLVSVMVLSTTN